MSNGGSNVQVKVTLQYTAEQREVSWRRLMWFVEHPGKTYPLELQEDMVKYGVGWVVHSHPIGALAPSTEMSLSQCI